MTAPLGHPRFVTFEGVDGAGKSTHVEWFAAALAARSGNEVVLTREPGGTPLGESLRALVLHRPMHREAEALVMFAARRELLATVIEPALARGAWVVSDRFSDATVAYQGGGRGLDDTRIATLRHWVHPDLEPAATILFDLAPAIALSRLAGARDLDRFEAEDADFFVRVRDAYLRSAAAEPRRFHVIDGAQPVNDIRNLLEPLIARLCSKTFFPDLT